MRPISDQLLALIPALLALVLLAFFSAPMQAGSVSLTPNVAWLACMVIVPVYPASWPRGFAFVIGLLQDVLFGTPLGSQALLTLLLTELADRQSRRQLLQTFQVRWLEAAGTLVVWHILLWAVCHFVSADAAPLRVMARAALVSAVWYPVFYFVLMRLLGYLPNAK